MSERSSLIASDQAGATSVDHSPSQAVASRLEAFFYRYRDKLVYIHATFFVGFLALIVGPLFFPDPDGMATPFDDFVLFAKYVLWGVWFPLTLLSVIVSGRSWCGLMCPMGAASEWANNHGLQRPIPAWMRWEGTPILSFLLVTILGQTLGVRDHPEAMAEIFGGTMAAAILVGLIWGQRKRAWCRHLCPIGLLLGVFSRLGAVQFTPKRKKEGGDRYTNTGICPTMIDVVRKEESRHCIECFRCVKPSSPGALKVRLRVPGEEVADIRRHHPILSEVWFFFLGIGIAMGGFLWLVLPLYQDLRHRVGSWFIENGWYWIGEAGPWWLMSVHPERREVFNWLDFMMICGFMIAVMLVLTAVLAGTTLLGAWVAGRFGGSGGLKRRFTELAYQYMPVALISLVIGLGGELFALLEVFGLGSGAISATKTSLFALSLLWSLYLGNQILKGQSVAGIGRPLSLAPGLLGSLVVALGWWPALFGL